MKRDQIPDNATELVDLILEHEGKRVQVDRAQMKEIIAIISDLVNQEWEELESRYILEVFIKNGARRAKRYGK